MSSSILDTILLLALPASGKSEVRKYIAHLSPQARRSDFHMGDSVQLDDFPYVHLARRIDDELVKLGESRIYFKAPDRSFVDPYSWGTLIQLLNEDYDDLVHKRFQNPTSAAELLFDRLNRAAERADSKSHLKHLSDATRGKVALALEAEARDLLQKKQSNYPSTLEGKTVVIEFARGGMDGSEMPLKPPFGYRHSLSQLSEDILKRSTILYVWVTPEESRRKNREREDPNDPGSILHHSVPLEVMLGDYGCDDMDWLEAHSEIPGTVTVQEQKKKFLVPIARFDNRSDKTSFIREDSTKWQKADVEEIHTGLSGALDRLTTTYSKIKGGAPWK